MKSKAKSKAKLPIQEPSHGEFIIREAPGETAFNNGLPIHNRLFQIRQGFVTHSGMVMTGEELTNLATLWLAYVKQHPTKKQ